MKQLVRGHLLMIILAITFLVNVITINLLPAPSKTLVSMGFIILGIGALLFVLSLITLRIKGTGKVIESGIYGIVRHPMYLGGMTMFFSHMFLGQNWIVLMSTIIAIVCCYLSMISADTLNIEKFGNDYKRYMQRVPRMNFLLGFIQLIQRKE